MKISIVVPVYNVEEYLEECLSSILNQTYENIEIVVVNDGATDGSEKIIDKFIDNKKLKLISQENKGLSAARNVGLNNSTGDYVLFLDSDDKFTNNDIISKSVEILNNNSVDLLLFDYCIWDNEDDKIYRHLEKYQNIVTKSKDFVEESLKKNRIMSVVWNRLINRELLVNKDIIFAEGLIFEDVLYTLELFYKIDTVFYLPINGIMYRQREGSIMNQKSKILTYERVSNYPLIASKIFELSLTYESKYIFDQSAYMLVLGEKNAAHLTKTDKERYIKLKEQINAKRIISSAGKIKYKLYYKVQSFRNKRRAK